VLVLGAVAPAAAEPFDLIHVSRLEVTLCASECGITPGPWGFGLIANTGATAIDYAMLVASTFAVTSSHPGLSMIMKVTPTVQPIPPILPGEVLGTVATQNQLLLAWVQPGESFRNTSPQMVFGFQISRTTFCGDPYVGPVRFDVAMKLGDDVATFPLDVELKLGPQSIQFLAAARSSAGNPTQLTTSSWGRLKHLYR
jgi:hypothetical protein